MTKTALNLIVNFVSTVIVLIFMLFSATGVLAVTVEEYKAKIDSARLWAIEFETSLRTDQIDTTQSRRFADQIRRDFPASERIEWQGGTVETSSLWLLDKASTFEKEADKQKRLTAVVEIREYLSAIAFKLGELKTSAADGRKDQDKQKLGEILRREEYQKPQAKQESAAQRWLTKFLEWLESLFPKSAAPSSALSAMEVIAKVFQILLFGALIALVVFLMYKIIPMLFPKLRRDRKPKKKKDRVILGEHLGEDANAVGLFEEAERLAREGNLRGAIRKGYIALLCDLNDRKVIGLARNKTNRDYLRDVRSRRDLHTRMKSATDIFERHWYGFQESADQDWAKFRDEYNEAIRSV